MPGCADFRELLSPYLEGELDADRAAQVRDHLADCPECRDLAEVMGDIIGTGSVMAGIEPPDGLAEDLAASPCRLWMGLLFQAVDREISPSNLDRLLTHLEGCPSCRNAWQDLTLIHQVADAIQPSEYLLKRCIAAREPRKKVQPILNRRLATAAAYFLAVFTSLVIGNPVTLARSGAGEAVGRVATAVTSEVEQVAESGRGEVRVMLWRVWKWGEGKVEAVRNFVSKDTRDEESAADSTSTEQGEI